MIRAKKSKYPPFDSDLNTSEISCNQTHSNVTVIQSNPIQSNPNTESESESNPSVSVPAKAQGGTQTQRNRFVKPTVEQIREYCLERNNNVDPEKFFDFYESKGWVVGKQPMKDWKACVRTWEKRQESNPTGGTETTSNPFLDMLRDMDANAGCSHNATYTATFTEVPT